MRALGGIAWQMVARWEALLVLLIFGAGVWSWTLSSFFLRRANLLDLLTPYIFIGLLAFGLTFVVIAGEIDISVVSNMAARLVFGKTGPFGSVAVPEGRRFRPDDSASWLPWQQEWSHVLTIGVGVGLAAAYLTARSGLGTGKEVLGFGISTVILTFLVMGHKVPVTHHISMPAALGVVHGGGVVVGALCGVVGAYLGEIASRVFLIHGDTHIDPPAMAIAGVATLLLLMKAAGIVLPPM